MYFSGHIDDTAGLYPALDVLVMPSLFEGLPMVLLEAMADEYSRWWRRPWMAWLEIVEDGREGILLSGLAGGGIQPAHRQASLSAPAQREQLTGDRPETRFCGNFSREAMAKNIEADL